MAKKDQHTLMLQRGLEQLREWGLPVEDLSPASIGRLTAHLGKGRESDTAVVALLGRIADPGALEALTSIERTTADKEIYREVRRSLYKLAQKGIGFSPEDRKGESVSRRGVIDLAPQTEAYLSSVDGAGGRLVWLSKPQAGAGIQLLQGALNDLEGLVQCAAALIPRKQLRRMAKDLQERHGVTMISIPWQYGDQILYQAYEKALALGRSGLEHFPSLRAAFNMGNPQPSDHPIYDRLTEDHVQSLDWRGQSRRLLDEPEFRLWILHEDWLKPFLEQIQEAQETRLVLNPLQKEERLAGIVRDAVQQIFSGDRGRIFSRRMEDMALYLLESRREELAKLALAVGVQLKKGELGPLDISFLSGLTQKSVAFYLSQAKAKTEESMEPSLIVKP